MKIYAKVLGKVVVYDADCRLMREIKRTLMFCADAI